MGNLTRFVPQRSAVVNLIYDSHVRKQKNRPPRGYLGGSTLGHECGRFLWYTFRGCVPNGVVPKKGEHPGRIYRLFETGKMEEARLLYELEEAGIQVEQSEVGPNGEIRQIRVSMLGGHMKGHLDAALLGLPEAPQTWHVAEIKTLNKKNFDDLVRRGVEKAKPEHYAQMQAYMGGTGMTRAAYFGVCKDDDRIYFERVKFDKQRCQSLLDRGAEIIRASHPPERIANRPDDHRCRFCTVATLCHGISETAEVPLPAQTCRTCCHATPNTESGGWECEKFSCALKDTLVGQDCPEHLLLPGLVEDYEAVDAGEGWIDFGTDGDPVWRHGKGGFSTKELMADKWQNIPPF